MGTIWIATAVMALALTALGILVLRFGPRRGDWNNPAAVYRAPGANVRKALLALALLTLIVGIIATISVSDGRLGILLVAAALAAVYLAMASSATIARRAITRREAAHAAPDAPAALPDPPKNHTD